MSAGNNKHRTYSTGRSKHLLPRKDEVSTFRHLTEEEIIQLKTIIRDVPGSNDSVAFQLYKALEGKPKNHKCTVKDGSGNDIYLTFEKEFFWNKKKLKYYKDKVRRSLDFKTFPKGTNDTYRVVSIIQKLAITQTKRRATSSLTISTFVRKIGDVAELQRFDKGKLVHLDNIGNAQG
jgi:hypothetical protein